MIGSHGICAFLPEHWVYATSYDLGLCVQGRVPWHAHICAEGQGSRHGGPQQLDRGAREACLRCQLAKVACALHSRRPSLPVNEKHLTA